MMPCWTISPLLRNLKQRASGDLAAVQREQFGPGAERNRPLLDPIELKLEDIEAGAVEDDLIAEQTAAQTTTVTALLPPAPHRGP